MSTTNPTDLFLVNRSDVSYYVTQANLMAQIKDDDLMLINRDDVSYKITGVDVKKSLVDPIELTVTLAPTLPVVDIVETATAIVGGGKEPDSGYVFAYQWSTATDATGTGKVNINGATNRQYTPVQSDSDKYLGCTVTTADAFGTAASTTTYAGPVDPGEKEPDITSVVLTEADGTDNDRFTSSTFPYTVDMGEEGKPDPTYALKAKLTGATFDFGVKSSTITGVADTVIPGGWTAASATEDNGWRSVTYGNNKFVAVATGGSNRVMYSTDGISWTAASATEANNWYSVTYGNGKFVAVAPDGTNRVMYSTDGTSWTAATAAEASSWYSVTYGNGKFVAVAQAGTNQVMYSTDGISWTASAAAEANTWRSVTYGDGKFVAVSIDGTNRVMYSTDGISWTVASAAEANGWYSVIYGNGKFVAVSSSGTNQVMYSTDAISWTAASAAEANSWQAVTYGDGKFVAVASSGTNRVMWSTDAINWTSASATEDNNWRALAYGGGKFVAVSNSGTNRVMWSLTGSDEVKATALTCASNSNLDKLNTEGGAVFMTDGDTASDGTYAIASYQPTSSAITTAVEDPGFNPISGAAVVNRGSFIGAPENIFKGLQPEVGSSLAGGYSAYTFGVNSSDSGNDGEAYIPVSVPAGNYSILCYSGQAANVTIGMQTNNISPLGQWTLVSFTDGFTPSSLGVKDVTYGGIAVIAGLYNRTTGKYTSIVDASTDLTFADPCTDLQYFNVGDTVTANESNALYDFLSPAFSTTLYTGDGSNRSINTGIDNTGKTLLWFKPTNVTSDHQLQSIEQGAGNWLSSNKTSQNSSSSAIQAYTETGVNVNGSTYVNGSGKDYVAWNFRAAPGFMDIVTYDGNGTNLTVPHSLGVEPGVMIIKGVDFAQSWAVYHKEIGATKVLFLENGNGDAISPSYWGNTSPTSTEFTVSDANAVNTSGKEHIAYLFADTPGLTKCGKYAGSDTQIVSVDCGFEPGWVLIKCINEVNSWGVFDNKRDATGNGSARLSPNTSSEEYTAFSLVTLTSTGFNLTTPGNGESSTSGSEYIYVAIAEGATAGEFIPTGIVAEEPNTTNRTLKLNNTTGNWADSTGFNTTIPASGAGGTWDSYTGSVATVSDTTGRWIGANAGSKAFSIAPVDGITEQTAEVYCAMQIIDDKAEVMGIQTTDPGFLNVTAKDYTIEFPALFTSGEAPDTALPPGTAITATVKAENTVGASVRESNTFIPQLIAPDGSAGPITGSTETVLTVGSSANLDSFVANDSLVMVDGTGAVASYTPTTTAITNVLNNSTVGAGWTYGPDAGTATLRGSHSLNAAGSVALVGSTNIYKTFDSGQSWGGTYTAPVGEGEAFYGFDSTSIVTVAVSGQGYNPNAANSGTGTQGTKGILTSTTDGGSWTVQNTPGNCSWRGVAYGNSRWIVVGESIFANDNPCITAMSTTNTNATSGWGNQVSILSNPAGSRESWWDIAYGNLTFVAVGPTVATTQDGISWTVKDLSAVSIKGNQLANIQAVDYIQNQFVVSANGELLVSSDDGATWVSRPFPSKYYTTAAYGVSYNDGTYVIATGDGPAWSPDLINFYFSEPLTFTAVGGVIYASKFILSGGYGATAYSLDGKTPFEDYKLTFTDNQDLAFLKSGDLLTSSAVTAQTAAFSTTLYTGTGAAQTITTGVDNTGKSLVWMKCRTAAENNLLQDTLRGTDQILSSNLDNGSQSNPFGISAFNNNGYTLNTNVWSSNTVSQDIVAWNFRAAPGFFDIVTYEGDGSGWIL